MSPRVSNPMMPIDLVPIESLGEPVTHGPGGDGRPRIKVELAEDVADVGNGGAVADVESIGNLAVGLARCE